jgi:hypothetical protein
MPRTRNITRAQWDAANATNSITNGNRNRNQHHDYESEKENERKPAARATRSQTRTGSRVFGSTTTANLRVGIASKGPENTTSTSTTKLKGKGKPKAPPLKRKKLPLQDITSQFLPAPEAANRGEENEVTEHEVFHQTEPRVNLVSPLPLTHTLGGATLSISHHAPSYLDSPLPPSSPPSAISPSLQYPKLLPNSNASWLGLSSDNNLWNQLDDDHSASHGGPSVMSSNSDPFGFVALERKLKVERSAAAHSPLKRQHQQEELDEDLGQVLVADTSSPRLVRRLKRSSYHDDSNFPPAISEHPNYSTPPTPHKDKKKRPRLSHEGDRIFSPCSSSMPSTPSPSKPPVQKQAGREHTNNLTGSQEVEVVLGRTRNRSARAIAKGELSSASKVTKTSLELGKTLDDAQTEEERTDPKHAKSPQSKKKSKKPRSTGAKKSKKDKPAEKVDDKEDYEEVCSRPGSGVDIKLTQLSEMGARTTRTRCIF